MPRIPILPLLPATAACALLSPAATRASAQPSPAPRPMDAPVPMVWTEPSDAVRAAATTLREACAGWQPRVPRPTEVDAFRPERGEPPEASICEAALDPIGRKDASSALAAGALLAAAGAGVAWGAAKATRGLIGLPQDALRRLFVRRRDRRMAARHEAAHALVATVLEMPFDHARVLPRWSACGVGGYVRFDSAAPTAASSGEVFLPSLLVRRTAMLVAGVAGERPDLPPGELLPRLQTQSDWPRALEASWIAEAVRPDRRVLEPVVEEVAAALRTPAWRAAIRQAAGMLLHARGEVPQGAFQAIARGHGLTLPGVQVLASGLPPGGAGETGRPEDADGPREAAGLPGCVVPLRPCPRPARWLSAWPPRFASVRCSAPQPPRG